MDSMIVQTLKFGIILSSQVLFYSCVSTQNRGTTEAENPSVFVVDEGSLDQSATVEGRTVSDLPPLLPLLPLPPLPTIPREFRGVWIATVKNADWPSRQDLTSAEQQAELRAMFDRARDLNLNAIIFQVRSMADAFYASELEPWSVFLNGKQGRAPDPFYDPLEFAIEEAHARGLELHAWFNPFRANIEGEVEEFAENHVARTEMVVSYGVYSWLDPGNADARLHSLNVAADILNRYDIDGFHMDDYFYPYPTTSESGGDVAFPDDASWTESSAAKDGMDRDEWRRQNVDDFVRDLQQIIRACKPWVKFGISPFGIWQPGYPEGTVGFNPHDKLYADSRKWLMNGWVDYLTPQLYWSIDSPGQSYPRLLSWWTEQNRMGRHLWPGNFTSRITLTGEQYWNAEELLNQIRITRETPNAGGNTHFRMISLMPASHGMGDQLKEKLYQNPALIPASPWLSGRSLPTPQLRTSDDGKRITALLQDVNPLDIKQWLVRELRGDAWHLRIIPGGTDVLTIVVDNTVRAVAFSVIDRIGREGVVAYENLFR